MPQMQRQISLLRLLAQAEYTILAIARRFATTSTKTIQRDLNDLRSSGFRIRDHVGQSGKKSYSRAADNLVPTIDMSFTVQSIVPLAVGHGYRMYA